MVASPWSRKDFRLKKTGNRPAGSPKPAKTSFKSISKFSVSSFHIFSVLIIVELLISWSYWITILQIELVKIMKLWHCTQRHGILNRIMLSKSIILGITKLEPNWNSLSRGGNSHLYSSRIRYNTKKYFVSNRCN